MPDHQRNGMLEDFVQASVIDDATQKKLLQHAKQVVAELPAPPLFRPTQVIKAELYTWLAWQKRPGQGLDITLDAELLDLDAAPMQGLCDWLRRTFAAVTAP